MNSRLARRAKTAKKIVRGVEMSQTHWNCGVACVGRHLNKRIFGGKYSRRKLLTQRMTATAVIAKARKARFLQSRGRMVAWIVDALAILNCTKGA